MTQNFPFIVCIKNTGYRASLEVKKFYQTVPDKKAEEHGQIRVIDESGEDYLYPKDFFLKVKLPDSVAEKILAAA